ncbi:MAG: shikimate dehydrogenase [Deltaproteobacteria bacterium]|nr:shikimate dehydrogenase [Deltaproteobacteria bacterium]
MSSINTNTKLCAIIGNPVSHSMSPAIHNSAFSELELNFIYLAFKVDTFKVKDVLMAMRHMENFKGLSVTIPHKVEVTKYVDEMSDADRNTGAINTVVKRDGKLIGIGSDGPGARKALLDKNADPKNRKVVILGNGGAARALAFDLAFNAIPSNIVIMGRDPQKARLLATDVSNKTDTSCTFASTSFEEMKDVLKESDILINSTSVGMHPNIDESIVNKELLTPNLTVMDIVYTPLKTQLLKDAEANGLKTVSGLDMFINQAAIQFEAWTGKKAPVESMRKIALGRLSAE